MQCDIDILGEGSNLAEIELILATTAMLGRLDFRNFTVNINDRSILKAMAAYCGFKEEDYDEVFIILDKMDKIGTEGVAEELSGMGYEKEKVEQYLGMFDEISPDHFQRGGCKGMRVYYQIRSYTGKRTVLLYRDDFRGDDG